MADNGFRYPELPKNNLLLSSGLMTWYDFITDTTYSIDVSALFPGSTTPDTVWNPDFEYSEGQVVSWNGKLWIATSEPDNLGQPPSDVSDFWDEEPDPTGLAGWPLAGQGNLSGSVAIAGSGGGNVDGIYFGFDLPQGPGFELYEFGVRCGLYNSGDGPFSQSIMWQDGWNFNTANVDYATFFGANGGNPSLNASVVDSSTGWSANFDHGPSSFEFTTLEFGNERASLSAIGTLNRAAVYGREGSEFAEWSTAFDANIGMCVQMGGGNVGAPVYEKTFFGTHIIDSTTPHNEGFIEVTDGTTVRVKGLVVVGRVSGGSAGDSAQYVIDALYSKTGGTLTLKSGGVTTVYEDQAGWNVTLSIVSDDIVMSFVGVSGITANFFWYLSTFVVPHSF